MGALNIPSAADIERLTRRLRSVSQRLEGIEDGVHRLDRALAPGAVEARLAAIEEKLSSVSDKLDALTQTSSQPASRASARAKASAAAKLRRGATARPGSAATDA